MDKKFFINVVNLDAGKVYSLPTLYTDRTEACVAGQNYVRDHRQENNDDVFFRVLIAKGDKIAEPWNFEYSGRIEDEGDDETCPHPEQDCCEECPFYSECWEFDDEDNDEEPEHGESVFGGMLVTELINLLKSEAPEAPEEPSTESLSEILSAFNSMTLNP